MRSVAGAILLSVSLIMGPVVPDDWSLLVNVMIGLGLALILFSLFSDRPDS